MPSSGATGPGAKRARKREEVVSRLVPHVLAVGLGDVSLRRLAGVAGTSDRMLLYYFDDKDDLLMAVLREIGDRQAVALDELVGSEPLPPAEALRTVWKALKSDAFADHLRLWLDLSSRAGRGDPVFGALVEGVRERSIAWASQLLDVPQREKRAVSLLLMAAIDGQVVLFPTDLKGGDVAIARLARALEQEPGDG